MIKRMFRKLILPYRRRVERVKVVQTVITKLKAQTYLEIGVDQGKVFELISCPFKIGVDPVSPAKKVINVLNENTKYIQKTSDAFFSEDADTLLASRKIDVAFIDGLHEYQQVLRDVENTLKHLAPNGVIVLHDCNPWSKASAVRAFSVDEAKRNALDQGLQWDGGWTGDVWKAVAKLRSSRGDLDLFVLDADCGLGVITQTSQDQPLDLDKCIEEMSYEDLEGNRNMILNLRPASYFYDFCKQLT